MHQVIATARNLRVTIRDDEPPLTVAVEIEAVMTLMDREYEFHGSQLQNTEKTSTFRFAMSTEGARKLAKIFTEWADEADFIERCLRNGEIKDKEPTQCEP